MKHELREFFPKVLGIYHPDGAFDPNEIKTKCEPLTQVSLPGHPHGAIWGGISRGVELSLRD